MRKIEKNQVENIAESVKRELNEDMQVSVIIRKKIPTIPDYVQLFQEAMKRMVGGEKMTLTTYRVFIFMLGSMEYQNFIGIDIKTLSEDLHVSVASIERAMKQLKELNIIISIKDTFDRRRNAYMINPQAAWKGKARIYVSAVRKMKNLNPGQYNLFNDEPVNGIFPEPMSKKTYHEIVSVANSDNNKENNEI